MYTFTSVCTYMQLHGAKYVTTRSTVQILVKKKFVVLIYIHLNPMYILAMAKYNERLLLLSIYKHIYV